MIRKLTLSLAVLSLMIGAADAAQMPASQVKPGIVATSHTTTGRSAWHHHWHRHYHWHHHHRYHHHR